MNPGSALDLDNFKKQAPNLYKNIGITDQNHQHRPRQHVRDGRDGQLKTKHTPAAFAFAHYVTDAQQQMSFAKKVAIFPSTAGSLDDPYFHQGGRHRRDARADRCRQVPEERGQLHTGALQRADEDRAAHEVAKALQGKESPQAAMDNAVKACNTLLQQQG